MANINIVVNYTTSFHYASILNRNKPKDEERRRNLESFPIMLSISYSQAKHQNALQSFRLLNGVAVCASSSFEYEQSREC